MVQGSEWNRAPWLRIGTRNRIWIIHAGHEACPKCRLGDALLVHSCTGLAAEVLFVQVSSGGRGAETRLTRGIEAPELDGKGKGGAKLRIWLGG